MIIELDEDLDFVFDSIEKEIERTMPTCKEESQFYNLDFVYLMYE